MADDEGTMEEGTYPKQRGGKHNGGIVDEMCANAGKNRKGESKKGGKGGKGNEANQ